MIESMIAWYSLIFTSILEGVLAHQAGVTTTIMFLVGCGLTRWGLKDCFDLKSHRHHIMWQVAVVGLIIAIVSFLTGVVIMAHSLIS